MFRTVLKARGLAKQLALILLTLIWVGCGSGFEDRVATGPGPVSAAPEVTAQELGGPDDNNDGVRDDIEAVINRDFAATEAQKVSMMRLAAVYRKATLEADSIGDSHQNADLLMRVLECTANHFPSIEEWSQAVTTISDLSYNTEARILASFQFDEHQDGRSFLASRSEARSCEIVESVFSGLSFQTSEQTNLQINQCHLRKTKIYFGNGVLTKFTEAQMSLITLIRATRALPASRVTKAQFDDIDWNVAYNKTFSAPIDAKETLDMAKASEGISRVRAALTPAQLGQLLLPLATAAITDLITHANTYKNDIVAGKRVIVVAHSQGNLFVNLAWNLLTPAERNTFGIMAVGTPDFEVRGGDPYVTVDVDLVIAAASAGRIANLLSAALPPNTIDGRIEARGHAFIDQYMATGTNSRFHIMAAISDHINDLPFPQPVFRAIGPLDPVPEIEPNNQVAEATAMGLSQVGTGVISPKAPDDPNTGLVDDTDHFSLPLPLGVYDISLTIEGDNNKPTFGFLDGSALRKRVCLTLEDNVLVQIFGGEAFGNTGAYSFEIVQAADYVAKTTFTNSGPPMSFRMISNGQLVNDGQTISLGTGETFEATFDQPIEDLNIIEFSPVAPIAQDLGFAIDVPCGFTETFEWNGAVLEHDQIAIPPAEGDCL